MQYVGLTREGSLSKVAILSAKGVIERLESFSELPEQFFQDKNLQIITGLASAQVLRRQVSLKLKKRSAILKALPFQLETLLPFEESETLVYPTFHRAAEGTEVIVFATSFPKVQHHIQQMQALGVDPDQVSCIPLALARFVRLLFPQEQSIRWINKDTGIVLDGEKILFSQAFDDPARLEAYLDLKFSSYFRIDEGPCFQDYSYQTLVEFAVPIGLALEGVQEAPSCQFRQKRRQKNELLKKISPAICLGLAVVTLGLGWTFLKNVEKKLEQTVAKHFTAPKSSLEEKISLWQQQIVQEAKAFPLLPGIPSVSEVLSWLGQLQEPIEIAQLHYSLVDYPNFKAKVELEFKAAGPAAAQHLQETLQKNPTLVDTKQKITWTAHQSFYKISFWLRKE